MLGASVFLYRKRCRKMLSSQPRTAQLDLFTCLPRTSKLHELFMNDSVGINDIITQVSWNATCFWVPTWAKMHEKGCIKGTLNASNKVSALKRPQGRHWLMNYGHHACQNSATPHTLAVDKHSVKIKKKKAGSDLERVACALHYYKASISHGSPHNFLCVS